MTKTSAYGRLDRILSGLEVEILATSDKDILSTKDASDIERKVGKLIDARLAIHDVDIVASVPNDARNRRMLFELIARTRSDIPKNVRMAFGSGRKVSDKEISMLLGKLVRSGFFVTNKRG